MSTQKTKERQAGREIQGIYEHYSGRRYRVIGIARNSETLEELVVYQALYENEFGKDSLWTRPRGMFFEEVEVKGARVPRFRKIAEDDGRQ